MDSLNGFGVVILWYVILAPAGVIFLAWLASHRHHAWWSEVRNHPRFYAGQALVWLPSLLIMLGFMLAETIRKLKRRIPEVVRKARGRFRARRRR